MDKRVNIGGVTVGAGMPKIAVPVLASDAAEAAEQGERIMRTPADLVELRGDYVAGYGDPDNVISVLSALKETVPDRPVLFTLRTRTEGGEADLSPEQYAVLCEKIMDTGMAEAVDIEFSAGAETTDRLLKYAKERGVTAVLSKHDFEKTPPAETVVETILSMESAGAAIAKMAVMPSSAADTAALLGASAVLREKAGIPFILIAMGSAGMVSRLSGEAFGSSVTFAQAGMASAPGQIDADDLDRVLRVIHGSLEAEAPDGGAGGGPRTLSDGSGNIALIGFMGTGKTTVSQILGGQTGRAVMEMDGLIEEDAGMSIPDIFSRFGEAYFRDLEEKVCARAAAVEGGVISCGGGTVLRQANVDRLKENGVIVLLEASPDTVFSRVSGDADARPKLAQYMSRGYISWLMKQRAEAYRRAADLVIRVDGKTAGQVAEEILRKIRP